MLEGESVQAQKSPLLVKLRPILQGDHMAPSYGAIGQNRYNAACSAALAASGKGIEKPPLDETA